MCGICGFIGNGDLYDLNKMIDNNNYRGPDDKNKYYDIDKNVFIGHTRLSIVDVLNGIQPMKSKDNQIVISYNGEVYNHNDLRKDLESDQIIFKTKNSDTEVVLKLYEKYGIEFVSKLNGMFAIAIYDKNINKLFLVRDRFGEKPLFYSFNKNLIFSSTSKAITDFKNFETEISLKSLAKYYAYGFIPSPLTIYKDIKKVEPGTYIEYDLEKKRIKNSTYWKYTINYEPKEKKLDEYIEEFKFLFLSSVKQRLNADVPVGVLLSGGIDSSSVAYYANKISKKKIETFSIGFENKNYDESDYFKSFSKKINVSNLYEILNFNKIYSSFDDIFKKLDEPISDPSLIPTYLACKLAKSKVKVLLSGDGADEIFCGYNTFDAIKISEKFEIFNSNIIISFLNYINSKIGSSDKYMNFNFIFDKFLYGTKQKESLRNPAWLSHLKINEINDYLNTNYQINEIYEEAINCWNINTNKNIVDKTSEFYVSF